MSDVSLFDEQGMAGSVSHDARCLLSGIKCVVKCVVKYVVKCVVKCVVKADSKRISCHCLKPAAFYEALHTYHARTLSLSHPSHKLSHPDH
jgi:hypothetical protein